MYFIKVTGIFVLVVHLVRISGKDSRRIIAGIIEESTTVRSKMSHSVKEVVQLFFVEWAVDIACYRLDTSRLGESVISRRVDHNKCAESDEVAGNDSLSTSPFT